MLSSTDVLSFQVMYLSCSCTDVVTYDDGVMARRMCYCLY